MTPQKHSSVIAERTGVPAISTLMQLALGNPDLVSLAAGFVDQQSLPIDLVAKAVNELARSRFEGQRGLQYGTTQGDLSLRKHLIRMLEKNEGVPEGEFQHALPRTVVTTGSQQLLYLIAEALLDPGDIVLVESPTYFVYLGVLETRGVEAIGVETDSGGLRLDRLEATLSDLEAQGRLDRVKLIYTVSEHSNPSGVSLAADRRAPLVELARRWSKLRSIYILEDAAYRGLTYDGTEPSSVWHTDKTEETVILARTFSKTFSPGLKVGWGILPPSLLEPVLRLKGNHDFGTGNFSQVLLDHLINEGHYEAQIQHLVKIYRSKRDALLGALETQFRSFEGLVSWTVPQGGLYVWLTLPQDLDSGPEGPLFRRCLSEGVVYVPGAYAFAAQPAPVPTNHARLCFGVPQEVDLVEGIRRLSVALADCLDPVA